MVAHQGLAFNVFKETKFQKFQLFETIIQRPETVITVYWLMVSTRVPFKCIGMYPFVEHSSRFLFSALSLNLFFLLILLQP